MLDGRVQMWTWSLSRSSLGSDRLHSVGPSTTLLPMTKTITQEDRGDHGEVLDPIRQFTGEPPMPKCVAMTELIANAMAQRGVDESP